MLTRSFTRAIDTFKLHPGPWVLFGVLFMIVGAVVPVLGGLLLLPNALRECKAAAAGGREPDLGRLFSTDTLGGDVSAMALYAGAQLLGLMMCCVGWPFAWLGLWYTAELAADGLMDATQAAQTSFAYVASKPVDTIAMALVCVALNSAAASVGLGLGLLITAPLTLLAWAFFWQDVREEVYALAQARGFPVAPEQLPDQLPADAPAEE